MLPFVVLLLLQVVAGTEVPPRSVCHLNNRIYGGEDAGEHEFPGVVALEITIKTTKKLISLLCGGSLISDTWILTAAHCVVDTEEQVDEIIILARAGSINYRTGETRRVKTVIVHEQYPKSGGVSLNDIALLMLQQPFDITGPNIQPVSLPQQDQPTASHTATYVGWGVTSVTEDYVIPGVLQKLNFFFTEESTCSEFYTQERQGKSLCHIPFHATDCPGDSGSPIFMDGQVVGIVNGMKSFTLYPSVKTILVSMDTRVAAYRDWITAHTGI